jgi:hypothetical protein
MRCRGAVAGCCAVGPPEATACSCGPLMLVRGEAGISKDGGAEINDLVRDDLALGHLRALCSPY